jgi:hypothetical protein
MSLQIVERDAGMEPFMEPSSRNGLELSAKTGALAACFIGS